MDVKKEKKKKKKKIVKVNVLFVFFMNVFFIKLQRIKKNLIF